MELSISNGSKNGTVAVLVLDVTCSCNLEYMLHDVFWEQLDKVVFVPLVSPVPTTGPHHPHLSRQKADVGTLQAQNSMAYAFSSIAWKKWLLVGWIHHGFITLSTWHLVSRSSEIITPELS